MEYIYQVECAKASSDNLTGELMLLQHKGHLVIDEVGECEQFLVIITTKMTKVNIIRAIKQGKPVDYLTVRYLATAMNVAFRDPVVTPRG